MLHIKRDADGSQNACCKAMGGLMMDHIFMDVKLMQLIFLHIKLMYLIVYLILIKTNCLACVDENPPKEFLMVLIQAMLMSLSILLSLSAMM